MMEEETMSSYQPHYTEVLRYYARTLRQPHIILPFSTRSTASFAGLLSIAQLLLDDDTAWVIILLALFFA